MFFQKFSRFLQREFTVRDRVLLMIIFCCVPLIVTGLILFLVVEPKETGEQLIIWSETVAELSGLILLLFNGTIMQTKYWRYIIISLVIVFISAILLILHLPGALEVLLAGLIMLEIVYTIRFVRQRYTPLAGWFKYGWICSWIFTSAGIVLHLLPEAWGLLPVIMFWITLTLFLREKWTVAIKYKGLTN